MRSLWHAGKSLILIGLGVCGLVAVCRDRAVDVARRELTTRGAKVEGRVRIYGPVQEGSGNRWQVSYSFTAANGFRYEIPERKVPEFPKLPVGSPVEVWYDPQNPSLCVIEPELRYDGYGLAGFWGLVGLFSVFVVLGCFLFYLHTRKAKEVLRDVLKD